jgi:uncharacterized membrane protein
MTKLDPSRSRAIVLQSLVGTGLTVAHSLRARGRRHTIIFAALGLGLPILGEYSAVNMTKIIRHHTEPQVKGVPLSAVLGWYNIGYATFAMLESLVHQVGIPANIQRWAIPVGTAAVATSLDLVLDCMGLDQGFWEWNSEGLYATDIVGPNGKQGIPASNFVSWLVLITSVALAYQFLTRDDPVDPFRAGGAGSVEAGRTAALLLAPYYLPAAAWAIQHRKFWYLCTSVLAPIVIALALRGRAAM